MQLEKLLIMLAVVFLMWQSDYLYYQYRRLTNRPQPTQQPREIDLLAEL